MFVKLRVDSVSRQVNGLDVVVRETITFSGVGEDCFMTLRFEDKEMFGKFLPGQPYDVELRREGDGRAAEG